MILVKLRECIMDQLKNYKRLKYSRVIKKKSGRNSNTKSAIGYPDYHSIPG